MGNAALTCYKGRAKVAVVLVDGNVEEYFKPVRVATVLNHHPKHMVAQVNSHCQIIQDHRKVTFLRPDQKLESKQQYVVLPNQSVSGKFIDCWTLASCALESSTRRGKLRQLMVRSSDHNSSAKFRSFTSEMSYTEIERLSTSNQDPANQFGASSSTETRHGVDLP
ncbi:hypothetical protein R1sor_007937 [Riccia sorocarpa]|uniref:Uncharacterized protein n=1 Tax=Riccia sorocarpa TaxID=122646 RepID=A0ABD3HW21_9MARC